MISSPENHRKGLVTDQMLRAEDGMPESEGFRLSDVTEVRQVRDVPHLVRSSDPCRCP